MKVKSSYQVQIVKMNKIFKPTVEIYQQALAYVINVVNLEWDNEIGTIFKNRKIKKTANNKIEKLLITTKNNMPKYDFEKHFYKMPSYLRRAIIQNALGCVSSYKSNFANWETKQNGKPPRLQLKNNKLPCFYNSNMYKETDEPDKIWLKLYINNDWQWTKIQLRLQDIKYIAKYHSQAEKSAPTLERIYKKYYLRFSFKEEIPLSNTPINEQKVLSVDLGINTDATCSVLASDGTILARKFINFASDKDQISHALNKIKKKQRKDGNKSISKLWSYTRNLNKEHSNKVAAAIVDMAVLYSVDCIVFEYLDFKGKKGKGSKRQKITMWRKNFIQKVALQKAHKCGIHISHICAWGTSKYAYDGSGLVKRDKLNYSLATFTTGKQYNCDLSASYNIGARYFIREILKPFSEKKRSNIVAKVPLCEKRTLCTWSTLISLNVVLSNLRIA